MATKTNVQENNSINASPTHTEPQSQLFEDSGLSFVSADLAQAGQIDASRLNPKQILQLQRTVGNQVVQRLIQQDAISPKGASLRQPQQDLSADNAQVQRKRRPLIVQRDEPAADTDYVAWAGTTRTAVERIQDAALNATDRLNADARVAITHIRTGQTAYNDFDRKYENAVRHFVGGVEAAQAKEQEMRENIKFVVTSAMAIYAPTASAIYEAIDGTITKVQRVSSILGAGAATGRADPSGGSSPAMAARREDRVDWNALLTTAMTAFESTLSNNETLSQISRACVNAVRFLGSVVDGSYTGTNPQTATEGQAATQLVNGIENTIRQLGEIRSGIVSTPCATMAGQITERLGGITERSLQQDLAIRWIAGLGRNERDQIDTADAYLRQIGVIDAAGNRLDYDTGSYTSDIDERIIHWRAQWENLAMGLVGSTATWLGSPFPMPPVQYTATRCIVPRIYGGRVRDNRNREWNVRLPSGATTNEGGGSILITSYEMNRMDSSGWEWSHPGDLQRQLQYEVTLVGNAVGPLGGGAPSAGPIMHAPD